MTLKKENAAPDVVVGAATGQHLCNSEISIPNDAPAVEGLLYPGTYIFAGSPKVGKSFFMAQLAYHVAAGIPLWEYPVRQGAVLYLALEDDFARLQKRLSRMFDVEGTDNLFLATDARSMADGLEVQMEQFITRHPDTVLIIIDTLQRIRELGGKQYSYAKDYEVIKSLKVFADKHGICFHASGRSEEDKSGYHHRSKLARAKAECQCGTTVQ